MNASDPHAALAALAQTVGQRLGAAGVTLVTAESCTGGMIAAALTGIAGSSGWFERGYVTYSNDAKSSAIGVPATLIERYGAVSEAVAAAMAEGALTASRADIAVSVTGIAGPGGGSPQKPVGTVCFGWAQRQTDVVVQTQHFAGDRATVRHLASVHALQGILRCLDA